MKKFMLGLTCGCILSFSTVALASDSVQAVLFPSKVTVHGVNETKDLAPDDDVINYNGKTYIPLRAFSEAMGSFVNYEAPSTQHDNRNKIDIYKDVSLIHSQLLDDDSIEAGHRYNDGDFSVTFSPTNQAIFTHGHEAPPFVLGISNLSEDTMKIKDPHFRFSIYSADSNYAESSMLYSSVISTIPVTIPGRTFYKIDVPWNLVTNSGEPLAAGKYVIKLEKDSYLEYTDSRSDVVKQYNLNTYMRVGGNGFQFQIN